MLVHWLCTCGEHDTYNPAAITTKTDAALPDAKHNAKCPGRVVTAATPGVIERLAEGSAA